MTIPGSDPFRPTFGSLAYTFLDYPSNEAIPLISTEMLVSIERWEPRVIVESVSGYMSEDIGSLVFFIKWRLGVGDLEGDLEVTLNGSLQGQQTPTTGTLNFINPETQAAIKSLNWQLSTEGFGIIAQGINDISQSIMLILSTRFGSDPFRPTFGSRIFDHIDTPLLDAAPAIVNEIFDAIGTWENRIVITGITYVFINHDIVEASPYAGIKFNIKWRFRAGFVVGNTDLVYGLTNDAGNQTGIAVDPIITVLSTESDEPILTESDEYLQP